MFYNLKIYRNLVFEKFGTTSKTVTLSGDYFSVNINFLFSYSHIRKDELNERKKLISHERKLVFIIVTFKYN